MTWVYASVESLLFFQKGLDFFLVHHYLCVKMLLSL
jgi:hypothetical protein